MGGILIFSYNTCICIIIFIFYYYNYFYFFWGGGVRKFNIYGGGGFCGYFFLGSCLCIYRGFLKFKVQNGNTLCRYLNLKYLLGMPDIPDIYWCMCGGGGGGNSRCLV